MGQNYSTSFILSICSYGDIRAQTLVSIEDLRLRYPRFQLRTRIGDALIGRARSVSATEFLNDTKEPYLLFLDGDIVFRPEDVGKILGHLEGGYDLVGGCYAVKDGSQLSSQGKGGKPLELDGSLQEIDYLATGFMGISRRLLEKMVKELSLPLLHKEEWCECYPFFESGRCGSIYISEDWDFCDKAKKVGVTPYLDTSVWLTHMVTRATTVEGAIYASLQRQLTSEQSEQIKEFAQKVLHPAPSGLSG